MSKMIVKMTRWTMLALGPAWFAVTAHADVVGVPLAGQALVAVIPDSSTIPLGDPALAAMRATNSVPALATSLAPSPPLNAAGASVSSATVVQLNTIVTAVRLWDEVIPPAPAPKPVQSAAQSAGSAGVLINALAGTVQNNAIKVGVSSTTLHR